MAYTNDEIVKKTRNALNGNKPKFGTAKQRGEGGIGGSGNTAGKGAALGGANNAPTKHQVGRGARNTNKSETISNKVGQTIRPLTKGEEGKVGLDNYSFKHSPTQLAKLQAQSYRERDPRVTDSQVNSFFQGADNPKSLVSSNPTTPTQPLGSSIKRSVDEYGNPSFSDGVVSSETTGTSNLGGISIEQMDRNSAALDDLHETRMRAVHGSRRVSNGVGGGGDSSSSPFEARLLQKRRESVLRGLSERGRNTKFGTATTVGGRDGVKNAMASFAEEDRIAAARASSESNYQLGLAQARNTSDQIVAGENKSIRQQASASTESQRKSIKDEGDYQLASGRLGNTMRGTSAEVSQKQVGIYAKLTEGMITPAAAIQGLQGSGMSSTDILNSVPGLRDWARKNEASSPEMNTPRAILLRFQQSQ